jgi:DNA-binding transcriptional ArsR family regulator
LAHPLRLRILDVLGEHGPLSATQVSEYVAESPQNCSFHLRTLARYGYVEDAGGGEGRNRPWKLSERTTYFSAIDADQETTEAIAAAQAAIDASFQEHVRAWRRRSPRAPRIWQENNFEMSFDTWLTPEEIAQVSAGISAAIRSVVEGRTKQPGREARVLLHASGFPIGEDLPDVPQAEVARTEDD